jgi:hypothetical protein
METDSRACVSERDGKMREIVGERDRERWRNGQRGRQKDRLGWKDIKTD